MEAWILHIKNEWYRATDQLSHFDKYSSWMTEKQAQKAAAKYLLELVANRAKVPFDDQPELLAAVKALVETDYVPQAIDLINKHSQASLYKNGRDGSSKITIIINRSTFLGSPFE